MSPITPIPNTQPQDIAMHRQDSMASDFKLQPEQLEHQPNLESIQEDNDQVGYNTFKAAQESGYEPVSHVHL